MRSDTGRSYLQKIYGSKGYTLIEVLVAMAIFSSMVMLASMALNQGLRQYQGLVEKGINFWDYARHVWINRSFSSAIDYYVRTKEDGWTPYFRGSNDVISYVSLSPLSGDLPVVVWIKREKEENGKSSLVYYELPVYTKKYNEIESEYSMGDYKQGNSVRLFEGIEDMEISFYGYDLERNEYMWYDRYDSRKRKILPSAVRISLAQEGHRRIFRFSLNVNSTIKMIYNDIY